MDIKVTHYHPLTQYDILYHSCWPAALVMSLYSGLGLGEILLLYLCALDPGWVRNDLEYIERRGIERLANDSKLLSWLVAILCQHSIYAFLDDVQENSMAVRLFHEDKTITASTCHTTHRY